MKRSLFSLVAALALLAAMAVPVAAHRQTVTPPGQEAPVILNDPISNAWAMAHCNSAAPFVTAAASDGVVQFNPPTAFTDCVPGTRGQGGN
jgi:hypothetical protein